jgi:hypothetical protein
MKQCKARVRLPRDVYEALRLQVLARDGWRCQACGRCSNLEVHHKEFRSSQGSDTEENLITCVIPVTQQCTIHIAVLLKSRWWGERLEADVWAIVSPALDV